MNIKMGIFLIKRIYFFLFYDGMERRLMSLLCQLLRETVITHYELTGIRNMDWGDIFVGLSGRSIKIKFVNYLIIMVITLEFRTTFL